MKKKVKLFTFVAGIVSIVISFVLTLVLNVPTIKETTFKFKSTYKEDEVTLRANIYEADDPEYAVLICPGYSCDRQKWRPFADIYKKNNMSVMTFDYSGQGGSYGRIGFDNAKTDAIPKEIDDAIVELTNRTGLPEEKIILMGHSMGGRSILRLLSDYNHLGESGYDTYITTKRNIKNVILLSPEVNYNHNAQASLFAGTSDADEFPWKDYSSDCIKGTDVYLFGSTADDVVNDKDLLKIFNRLGSTTTQTEGTCYIKETNSLGSKITLGITKGVLHSYQMYSTKFAKYVNDSIESITGIKSNFRYTDMGMVYSSWAFALAGIFLTIFSFNYQYEYKADDIIPEIIDTKKFLLNKLFMWLPGIGVAFLVCCLCIVMPFGSPIMNIPYMCFIAGYGLLMLLLYGIKKFKGVQGKLPRINFKVSMSKKNIITVVLLTVGLCFFTWYTMRGSMYRLIPWNIRIFWVIFASILMTIGYYISGIESDMLDKANAKWWQKLLYQLIQYVPLFLFALFYAVIKSYSELIGQVQNIILMYIFCIPLGDFIRKRMNNRIYGAFASAFLFQTIMITSAAIISMF